MSNLPLLSSLLNEHNTIRLTKEEVNSLADGDALAQALYTYSQDRDFVAFYKRSCTFFGVSFFADLELDDCPPGIREYTENTLFIHQIKGPFTLYGITRAIQDHGLFRNILGIHHFRDSPFPALCIGNDGAGTDFWLLMKGIIYGEANGYIVSLPKDDLLEKARDIERYHTVVPFDQTFDSRPEYLEALQFAGAPLNILQLIDLQISLYNSGYTKTRRPPAGAARELVGSLLQCSEQELEAKFNSNSMKFLHRPGS